MPVSTSRAHTLRSALLALFTGLLTTAAVLVVPSSAQAAEPAQVRLIEIICYDESEAFSDEPYLTLENGPVIASWSNVDGGGTRHAFVPPIHQNIQIFNTDVLVLQLFEDDGASGDDFLGNFFIPNAPGNYDRTVRGSGYEYVLVFDVTRL